MEQIILWAVITPLGVCVCGLFIVTGLLKRTLNKRIDGAKAHIVSVERTVDLLAVGDVKTHSLNIADLTDRIAKLEKTAELPSPKQSVMSKPWSELKAELEGKPERKRFRNKAAQEQDNG